jgi:hypothetical protein
MPDPKAAEEKGRPASFSARALEGSPVDESGLQKTDILGMVG